MATGKVIGKIEVASIGNVKIVGVDGSMRDAVYEGLMYEGEQLVSNDPETLFQIRYLALPEATAYEGVFGVLADGSVIANVSELDTLFGEDIDFMETAAGSGEPDANSGIPEDAGIVADSSVQGFSRGANSGVAGLDGVMGTKSTEPNNNQPVVDNLEMSVLETADEDYSHDTGDDVITTLTGVLVAGDVDKNDTHVFYTQDVNVTSSDIDPSAIAIGNVVLTDNTYGDSTPNSAVFTIEGNFNALAAGETATVTFQYYAVDDSTLHYEPNASEIKMATITVTGTNDQPVVTDVNANIANPSFWNLVAEGASVETVEALAEMGVADPGPYHGSNTTDGSAIRFTVETGADELVSFNWDFISDDYSPFNDYSFVVVDGALTMLDRVSGPDAEGNTLFSHLFTTAGQHTITFGVMNYGDTLLDSELNVEHISGGTIVDFEYVGNVSQDVITFYETTSTDNPLVDNDASDVYTTFEGALPEVQDDDVNDTHTYHMLEGSVTVSENIPTQSIVVGQLGGETLGLDNWGESLDEYTRVMTLDNGMTITTSSDSKVLAQYDHGSGHIGEGIGDSDGSGINAGETITVTFDGGFVIGATFGFDGLGGHFQPGSVDAKATWTAYNNGVEVASGEVQRDGDNFVAINAGVPFDAVVFGTDSDAGSNWELRYIDAEVIPVDVVVDENGEYDVVGNFNYLNVGETAEVTFQYYVVDDSEFQDPGESNTSEPKTVTLTITGTNDVPIAVADTGTTSENVTLTMDVLANDTDIDNGAVLSLDEVSVGEGLGSVSIVSNELFFDPGTDFDYLAVGESTQVEVSYTISDEHGAEASSTATITVTGTNDAPVISESDVLFVSEAAGYNNVLVAYVLDEGGDPINPVIAVMDTNSGHTTGSLMSSLDMPAGDIHFAIIANGQSAYPDIANATLTFDTDGAFPQLLIDGSVSTKPVYFDQNNFNPDGKDHFDTLDNGDGTVTINMEDLNLGDDDRQDLVITLVDNTVGDVKELADGDEFENVATLTATGALSFDDLDLSDSHTVSAAPNEAGYLGTLTADISPAATGPDVGQINWNYSVNDADVNHLAEGETLTQVYTVTVDDGHGGTDTQDITITIEGTNDAPIAYDDTVTKVADHVDENVIPEYLATTLGTEVVITGQGDYVVNDMNTVEVEHRFLWWTWTTTENDADNENRIDSYGEYNEGIGFYFDNAMDTFTMGFEHFRVGFDNVTIELYNADGLMDAGNYSINTTGYNWVAGSGTVAFSSALGITAIKVYALDMPEIFNETEFTITSASGYREFNTIINPFIIDDATLLANDIDEDGDILSITGVDGQLVSVADGTTIMGSVSIDGNGDVLVTPNSGEEFTAPVTEYATFEYTIDDGNDGVATATATINIRTGSLVEGVEYADVDNALVVEGTIDLSDVSNINVIQLDNDNTPAILDSIDAEDVIGATGDDNTLIINSLDGGATDQVSVHETMTQGDDVSINGTDYASYSGDYGGDMATLLVEIEPPIDAV